MAGGEREKNKRNEAAATLQRWTKGYRSGLRRRGFRKS
jgi:hypothetical protein